MCGNNDMLLVDKRLASTALTFYHAAPASEAVSCSRYLLNLSIVQVSLTAPQQHNSLVKSHLEVSGVAKSMRR